IKIIELLLPGKHIDSIDFLDKEQHGLEKHEKGVTFDLLRKDRETGEQFLVEMQNDQENSFPDRMLSYSTYPIREQMERRLAELVDEKRQGQRRGQDKMNYTLTPVYVLSLVNFSLAPESDEALEDAGLISRYSVRNDRNGEPMTDALHFVYVEMGRFPYTQDEAEKCETLLEKFIYSIKYIHRLKSRPKNFEGELLDMLYTASEKAKMTMTELQNYDKIMYTELDRLAQLEFAEERGEKKGLEKGRNDALLETAHKMQAAGAAPSFIKEMTGIEL
ncbi:MAG: PD-(D/E)XK nuclease family transposase, partial [Bacteroidales bacterium]|nr:PD-(D/E)XK nuclease family transposase [Bacteroidales bacterium]